MQHIKVLGSGCTKCVKTAELIEKLAKGEGVDVSVTKVTDPEIIMSYGVMSTPAVVVDETLVHSGSIPHAQEINSWFQK
jgi:small redox-active disulfide protein 2